MENKGDSMILNNTRFIDALNGLQEFVLDTSADIDMAYDWVCDQAEIGSFVHDLGAWNCFYDVYSESINW